ncbi:MAG: M42 family metallopeptidase [Eubacteriales bacterium]|jgi:endoglucanase
MKRFSGVDLLRELCLAFGPSGCEGQVAGLILEQIAGTYDDCRTDRMGNIIAHICGGGEGYDPDSPRKIMISAHMDEVGFMINDITEKGCLKFVCIGGIDPRVLPGRGVVLGDEEKRVCGVIGSKAIHLQSPEERKKVVKADKLYIDIGAKDKEEAQKHINLGDFGAFDSDFVIFGSGDKFVKCKAVDDRLGCAVLIEVMRRLADTGKKLPFDLYFCFTVREETGYSGAGTVANALSPDFSIVVEATAVADIAGVPEAAKVAKLGEGGVVSYADKGTIYDREFAEFALSVAKENNIKAQVKRYVSGSNDAAHIQRSGRGVRTLALSAPARYIHSPSAVAAIPDIFAMEDLIVSMLCGWKL